MDVEAAGDKKVGQQYIAQAYTSQTNYGLDDK